MSMPQIAQLVHYVSYGTPGGEYQSQCRAALITEVTGRGNLLDGDDWVVSLCVLNPTGVFFNRRVSHAEKFQGGTWHHLSSCGDANHLVNR